MGVINFLKQVLKAFGEDKIGQHSAAFSYIALFALGPLLLVLISIVGLVYGQEAASGQLFNQLSGTVGADTADTIQQAVAQTHSSGGSGLALILGIVGMLLAAAGITNQLQNTFNTIFCVVPDPKAGLKRTIYVKLKNSLLVIVGGIAVAASVIASAIVAALSRQAGSLVNIPSPLIEGVNALTSLVLFIILLSLIYRAVPDVKIPPRITLAASAAVAVLFIIGKVILGFVIGRNGTASAYGAAASLITLLLWIYYSSQILFLGAEGMKVWGQQQALTYAPKRFNRKRQTIHLDSNRFVGRMMEALNRGYQRGTTKRK